MIGTDKINQLKLGKQNMSVFEEIIIRGENNSGRKFRPSDWAERLCGLFAAVGPDNRTRYSPHVYPVTRQGVVCVVVNKALESEDSMLFGFLMDFARDNDLMVVEGRKQPRE